MPRGDHWKHWTVRLLDAGRLNPDTGCIEWQQSKNSRGYGVIYFDGKLQLAHRAAWFAKHGEWPTPGMVTDHICANKGCVNIDHLRELTNSQNIRRAYPLRDAAHEQLRTKQREYEARYRARAKARGGESNRVV